MKVYIIYDRYERDEWFNIDFIGTDRSESVRKFKEECLSDFIMYGPDDCHSYQLQEVELTQVQYDNLMKWYNENQSLENYGKESSDLFNFMVELFDETGVCGDTSVIISTDGCSDIYDIVHYYGKQQGLDTKDDDIFQDIYDKLCEDDQLFEKVLREYINIYY